MDLLKLFNNRYSVRKYKEKKVDKNDIRKILEAGRLAPSATNSQPWFLYVINKKSTIMDFSSKVFSGFYKPTMFASKSNFLIAIKRTKGNRISKIGKIIRDEDYRKFDIGILATHMVLEAESLGIGSCIIGWFDKKKANKYFNISKNENIDLLIAFGYPQENLSSSNKKRKTIEKIHSFIE